MSESLRSIDLVRETAGRYRATNARGGVINVGSGQDTDFTPVELLLAAIAGCSAIDVDAITGKRAEPTDFTVTCSGDKIRDDQGNRMTNLTVSFQVAFPDGEAGDAARQVLPRSVEQSRDRLCTVSRTVQIASPVEFTLR